MFPITSSAHFRYSSIQLLKNMKENSNKGGYIMRMEMHYSLYPPPPVLVLIPYTIHPLLMDLILGESANYISEDLNTRNTN